MSQPRIRTLKPEIWDDELLNRCSVYARLLFIGLITQADDEGRLRGAPARVAARIFQYDEFTPKKVDGWLCELEAAELIVRYVVADQSFIQIRSFTKHQVINKKKDSTHPVPPPDECNTSTGQVPDSYRTPTVPVPDSSETNPVRLLHGSGREGKGTEGSNYRGANRA